MPTITDPIREFLATGPYAHLVTLRRDGSPQVSLVWAGFDGDEIVLATFTEQPKLENMRRDPRVALSFQAKEYEGQGLHPYMVIEGTARVSEGGALAVMDHLAQYYMGPGARFPMRNVPPGFVTRVAIERVSGVGPWRERAAG